MTTILGAGLSGLIAATQMPGARVLEANSADVLSHRAVLRFRTDALSNLTGIPFRKVLVRKSIWHEGRHVRPNIQLANFYSKKTNGHYHNRSIWNLDPVERFIAPEDLQGQLASIIGNRIEWGLKVDREILGAVSGPIISTIPMPAMVKLVGSSEIPLDSFRHAPILVDRYRVRGADLHQTIYYPSHDYDAYRATVTGDLLIVERRGALNTIDNLRDICESFGFNSCDVESIEQSHTQRFGKISPLPGEHSRKSFIYNLTTAHGIYSLGRFAIWKNILLDDVVHDIAVIKRLISQGSYGASLLHHRKDLP